MDGVIVGGIIGASAAIVGAGVTPVVAGYVERGNERRRRVQTQAEKLEGVLSLYRDPLSHAAFDLQGRLFNIVRGSFLDRFLVHGNAEERAYAETSTLWRVAQYLGWSEIVRREIQFLDLGDVARTKELTSLQTEVRRALQSDRDPSAFRLFVDEQRAIGEIMIIAAPATEGRRVSTCRGYADFNERAAAGAFDPWLGGLRSSIAEVAPDPRSCPRLVTLQHALVGLVRFLDPEQVRFPPEELSLA
jgi:hypothetical protein